jgi:MFS transporter, DHA1 family, multidrug resistance protein
VIIVDARRFQHRIHLSILSARAPDWRYIVLLSLLLGAQPIATDLYLPALPALRAELGNPSLTFTALLLAFGASQLFWGPVSDHYGRRPVAILGSMGYALACLAAAFAESMTTLVICRALQGVAMAALIVVARASSRDLFSPQEGTRILSKGLSGLGGIALLSPLVGAALATITPWRGSLMAMGVFGVIVLVWLAWAFPESLPPNRRSKNFTVPGATTAIVSNARFRAWTYIVSTSYGTLLCFLLASSFVYGNAFGLGVLGSGFVLAGNCVFYIVGTVWCRRLLSRMPPYRATMKASWFHLAGAIVTFLPALLYAPWLPAMLVGQFLFSIGHGVVQPCAQAGSVADSPLYAGRAAALSGFSMMVVAFIVGQILSPFLTAGAWPLVVSISIGGPMLTLLARTVLRRAHEAN